MWLCKAQSAVVVALIILFELSARIAGQALPKFEGSFYASGEIFRSTFEVATSEAIPWKAGSSEANSSDADSSEPDSSEEEVEIKLKETNIFEEAYDAVGRKAALRITLDKEVIVFFEDLYTKHRFVIHTSDGHTTCRRADKKDWQADKYLVTVLRGPHKRKYTFLRDILTLRRKAKVRSRVIELVRDMYCRVFDLNITDPQERYIRPVIYWTLNETVPDDTDTAPATTTPAPQAQASRPPPGITDLRSAMNTRSVGTLAVPWMVYYTIDVSPYTTEAMTMRIFNIDYIRQSSVNELLEIPDGVYCPGNYFRKWLPHPVYNSIKVLCYSAQVWNSKTKTFSVIKAWLDVYKRLFRLDYTPWFSKDPEPVTIIAVDTMTKNTSYNRVYKISRGGTKCKAIKISKLQFDPQMILLPSDISHLTTKTFFTGRKDDARLIYTKVIFKRGIPCHLWSMKRTDWPPGLTYVVSLWQWCFINKEFFTDPSKNISSQLVSLDIIIEDVYYKRSEKYRPYEIGQTFSFYFYNVNSNMNKLSETEGFAPTACYKNNDRKQLRIRLSNESLSAELLRKPDFLFEAWSSVRKTGGILNPRLHITDFKATQQGKRSFFEFTLWGTLTDLKINSTHGSVDIDTVTGKLVWHAGRASFNFTYNQVEYIIDKVCYI
uniref:Putative secreted protein n=1 Tax=Ixodes ricinus TaxID=34613 RepID=A0A147BEW3_IXORI